MADTTSAAPSEREKFEAWLHDNFGKRSTVRAPDGYAHSVAHAALPSTYASVQMLWEAWQAACRAQPTPPAADQEPFGYFRAEPFGWTDCAETDEGAVALYDRPAPPAVVGQCEDAIELLGKYKELCEEIKRGDSYHIGRIDAAISVLAQAAPQPAVQQWNDLIGKETHADADGLLVWRDEVDFAIPTPQADSQPAQVLDSLALMKVVMRADEALAGHRTRGTTNWAAAIGKAVQDAVLAARAPADSATAPAAHCRTI